MRKLKQFFSESGDCDYVEIIFDADGDLTSLNKIEVRIKINMFWLLPDCIILHVNVHDRV